MEIMSNMMIALKANNHVLSPMTLVLIVAVSIGFAQASWW